MSAHKSDSESGGSGGASANTPLPLLEALVASGVELREDDADKYASLTGCVLHSISLPHPPGCLTLAVLCLLAIYRHCGCGEGAACYANVLPVSVCCAAGSVRSATPPTKSIRKRCCGNLMRSGACRQGPRPRPCTAEKTRRSFTLAKGRCWRTSSWQEAVDCSMTSSQSLRAPAVTLLHFKLRCPSCANVACSGLRFQLE
eukprot:5422562-Prymnesium_polylepis.1